MTALERSDRGRANLRTHPPFEAGNQVAVKHGALAVIRLEPRAQELAAELAPIVPASTEADGPLIAVLAMTLARLEAAHEYLSRNGLLDSRGSPRPLLKLVGSWENTAARLSAELGLSPLSRARLGLDLSRARGEALRQHLSENYERDGR